MITKKKAQEIALRYLSKMEASGSVPLALYEANTLEEDFGWVFFYDSSEYIRTGEFRRRLAGNAPLIVDKHDGSLHVTGTAHGIDFYISQYRDQIREKKKGSTPPSQ